MDSSGIHDERLSGGICIIGTFTIISELREMRPDIVQPSPRKLQLELNGSKYAPADNFIRFSDCPEHN